MAMATPHETCRATGPIRQNLPATTCEPFTIGLRFLSPSPQVLDAIEAFIDA